MRYIVLHKVQQGQEFNGEDCPKTGWAWTLIDEWPPTDLTYGDGPFESYEAAYRDAERENEEADYGADEAFRLVGGSIAGEPTCLN